MDDKPVSSMDIKGEYNIQADRGSTASINVNHIYKIATPQTVDPEIIEQGRKQLAELPLDVVPEPAAVPQYSSLAFAHNPLFVGREKDLKELAVLLKGGKATAIGQVAAATGMGGIGKTQLASEFVHCYGRYFAGGVYWLDFADPKAVPSVVAACCRHGETQLDLETQLKQVLSAWQSDLPRLLVFDNCEQETLFNQWRPKTGAGRILVTSRRQSWNVSLGISMLPLGVLERRKSIELLCKLADHLAENNAAAIAEQLGDLPLALHLAGSFLNCYRDEITPAAYLQQLQAEPVIEHQSLRGRGGEFSPTDHELHVERTFALSYNKLDENKPVDQTALKLLHRAAFFAPGTPIPKKLLFSALNQDPANIDPLSRKDGLDRLLALGMIETNDQGELVLHRLLVYYVRAVAVDETAQENVETALLMEADRINNAGLPAALIAWQPHLRFVTDQAKPRNDELGAGLCNELGYLLQAMGDYNSARPYCEQALAIRKKVLGEEHPDTATSLDNMGGLLQSMGDYDRARPYCEQALAIRKKVLGEEYPDTATSLDNMGGLLQSMGDYDRARPYYEQALAISKKMLGEEHPDTAASLNNMGYLLQAMGDYNSARPYYKQALAISKKMLGEEHPDTAVSLNNMGGLLESMGDYDKARPYYEQALAIRKKVLGEEHPDTATSLNNMGALLQSMGGYDRARPYYEQALAIRKKVLGEEHPDTATSLNNMGALLRSMGDYDRARSYYEQALAISKKMLGEEHPDTAASLNNMATLCFYERKFEEAALYMRQAVTIYRKVLGNNHPDTKNMIKNLAVIEDRL